MQLLLSRKADDASIRVFSWDGTAVKFVAAGRGNVFELDVSARLVRGGTSYDRVRLVDAPCS